MLLTWPIFQLISNLMIASGDAKRRNERAPLGPTVMWMAVSLASGVVAYFLATFVAIFILTGLLQALWLL